MVRNLQCLTEAKCITTEATRELKIEDLSLFSCGRQQRQNITANEESDTVDYLIMHELIMHKSRNAWVLVGNNDGTRGKCIHNA